MACQAGRFLASSVTNAPMVANTCLNAFMHRAQTPRRRIGSFLGRLSISRNLCYFSCVLFGSNERFRKFAK